MQYKKETNVICLGDSKQAALYFDRVFPINLMRTTEGKEDLEKPNYVFANLLGLNLPYDSKTLLSCFEYLLLLNHYFLGILGVHSNWKKICENCPVDHSDIKKLGIKLGVTLSDKVKDFCMSRGYYEIDTVMGLCYLENIHLSKENISFRSFVDDYSSIFGISHAPVLLPNECLSFFKGSEDDISISISNIPLVDTEKVEWEKILEFRKDTEARKKLRNLKLFLHENYKGRSPSFIEDDLNKRLEDHKNACKDWGFDTIASTLSAAMDSRSAQLSLSASLIATLSGEPIVITGAALPAIMEVGKITIEFIRKKHAFHKLKRDHDLAYIIEAKERFKNI